MRTKYNILKTVTKAKEMVDSLTRKSVSSRLSKTLFQKQGGWFLRKGSTHIHLPPNTLTHTHAHTATTKPITYSTSLQIKITVMVVE